MVAVLASTALATGAWGSRVAWGTAPVTTAGTGLAGATGTPLEGWMGTG